MRDYGGLGISDFGLPESNFFKNRTILTIIEQKFKKTFKDMFCYAFQKNLPRIISCLSAHIRNRNTNKPVEQSHVVHSFGMSVLCQHFLIVLWTCELEFLILPEITVLCTRLHRDDNLDAMSASDIFIYIYSILALSYLSIVYIYFPSASQPVMICSTFFCLAFIQDAKNLVPSFQ